MGKKGFFLQHLTCQIDLVKMKAAVWEQALPIALSSCHRVFSVPKQSATESLKLPKIHPNTVSMFISMSISFLLDLIVLRFGHCKAWNESWGSRRVGDSCWTVRSSASFTQPQKVNHQSAGEQTACIQNLHRSRICLCFCDLLTALSVAPWTAPVWSAEGSRQKPNNDVEPGLRWCGSEHGIFAKIGHPKVAQNVSKLLIEFIELSLSLLLFPAARPCRKLLVPSSHAGLRPDSANGRPADRQNVARLCCQGLAADQPSHDPTALRARGARPRRDRGIATQQAGQKTNQIFWQNKFQKSEFVLQIHNQTNKSEFFLANKFEKNRV